MTDAYVDPQNFVDPADFIVREQRRTMGSAIESLDANPDDAARAQELAKASGANPALVYGDLENFEQQHKAAITAQLLNSNKYLRQYVDSHPLADKISNDDYGQLDAVSDKVQQWGVTSVLGAAVKGFRENFDAEGLVTEHEKLASMLASHPVLAATLVQTGIIPAASGATLAMKLFSGTVGGAAAGVGEAYKQLGGNEAEGQRLTRDLITMAQVALSGQAGLHGPLPPALKAQFAEAARLAKTVEPYVAAGKEPPAGLHPVIDQLKTEQAKTDADALSEALKEATKSATRERSPELFADYVRQINDGEIGISVDAVRALYGDKPIVPGEGPLGFVGDLEAQLQRAEATGGDIKIGVADWLAKVEPEVARELKDHIRARPEGVTVEEGKGLAPVEAAAEEPVQVVRQTAGLQGVQERKLSLRRMEGDISPLAETTGAGGIMDLGKVHGFDLIDEHGANLGYIALAEEKGGKRLFVDDIGADLGSNSIGPRAMRDILEQIKEQFPEAETLEGMRVSGAREKAAKQNVKAAVDLTKIKPRKKPEQLELDVTRIEDKEVFAKASAIGMTVKQYERYQQLIEKRASEDAEHLQKRAMEDQRKRQTQEWKANRAELLPKVREEVINRPEVELDEMLRDGKLKFREEMLTDDQKAALPKEYVAKDGIHPDDLAGLFGDIDGRTLVDRVITLDQARKQAGMKPKAFLERTIEAETDRQMEARYGSLEKNILEEAKDQVLSETQEDLLYEGILARASEAGLEFSIGKDDLRAAIKDFFDRQKVKDVSSDAHLAESGRAYRAMEMAFLKGDAAEAFRQSQRQFNAIVMANHAKRFEKAQAQFNKLADRYKDRVRDSVEQDYTNWVRDLLLRTGKLDPLKGLDLQGLIARSDIKTLAEFVDYKTKHDLREVPVADFLTDPDFRKPYDQLTVAEARDLHDAVKTLDKQGREEKKYIREGEAHDLAELKGKLIESLQRFKEIKYDTEGKRVQFASGVRGAIRTAIAAHLQLETVFNRLDRYDLRGVWNQYVFRPLAEAANHEAALEREVAKKLGAVADNVNLHERIPNTVFRNPFDDTPMALTRKNLRVVMLNMGNDSNFTKLAAGYLGKEDPTVPSQPGRVADYKAQIRSWVDTYATKQDWDWAQKMWDILADLGQRSDTMYRSLTGVAPEKLEIKPIQTPHGEYRGGYYPLIRHEVFGEDVKLQKNDLEGAGYVRATTAAGYTKKRTGAIYPLALDLDALPNAIKQIIHDTAMRPAIIEVGKIFYDNKVKNAFKQHLGTEYADMLIPWLKDVANTQNYYSSKLARDFMAWSDFMRQNAITTLVGFNIGTFMKHTPTALVSSLAEVGIKEFSRGMKTLLTVNEETGESNYSFMMRTSEEMQRRQRNWVETMGGGMRVLEGRTIGKAIAQHEYGAALMSLRDIVTQVSTKPIAMGDFLSSGPTWLGRYVKEMEEHGVHGDAVYAADKAARQAHGSTAITSRSAVARSRALSWFTGFFTFFNDLFNRQVETVWRAGEAVQLAKEGQKAEAMKEATKVMGRIFAYVIAPAMIEELVTPLTNKDKESWAATAAKALTFTLSSSYVGVRDIVSAMLNDRDPSAGLISTLFKSASDIAKDLKARNQKPENIIKHGTQLSGMLTGLTPAPLGKAGAFLYQVEKGKERPKGPWGWLVGLRYGTTKHHAPTFEQLMKGH